MKQLKDKGGKKYRFSLFIEEQKKEPFIMVNADIIYECIFKDKKSGTWEHGMALAFGAGQRFIEISPFNQWKKAKTFSIVRDDIGFKRDFSEQEVKEMKKAIMKVDKRIKL